MDDDGDGFGSKNEALSSQICPGATKPGYVDNDDDCNDYDASAPKTCADDYPGQCESKSDGCGGTITCYCNSGYGCYSGTCVNIVADCADGSCDGVIGSSSYFLVGLDSSNKQGIAYNIKPSGIHFNKNLSVSFNYNQEEFSTNPKLYKYHDDSFENGLYNISVLEEVNQTIGEDGGTLELGDIKFEIQSEDLIEDINFTLRKVNITLSNNTIAEEDTQPPIEEELKTSLVSMIKSWIMEDNSVNIMSQFISIIRALFSSS